MRGTEAGPLQRRGKRRCPLCRPVALGLTSFLAAACIEAPADAPRSHAVTTGQVPIQDAVVHYRTAGEGPPLLLLHGFLWSGATWERFAEELASRYRLVIPDLPGHGHSTGTPLEWRYPHVATQMFEFLDSLGIERIRGVGCSAGAITLLHMALQQPDRVEAMVLVSGSHRMMSQTREALRSIVHEPPEFREWNRLNNPRGDRQIQQLLALLRGIPDGFEDIPIDRLAGLPTPTLLAWGDRDGSEPLQVAMELYGALPNASLWVVPDAGHCPFWKELPGASGDAAAIFPDMVLTFLAGQGLR